MLTAFSVWSSALGSFYPVRPLLSIFPTQPVGWVGAPSYFIDLPGVNPCKSSRATGRAPQKRRRAGGSGYASHGAPVPPWAPTRTHRSHCGGTPPRDEPSGRIGPTAVGPRPAMNPAGRLPLRHFPAKPENNSGYRTAAAAMRLTGAPCSPVIPLRPPAGFWLPREPAAAFVL